MRRQILLLTLFCVLIFALFYKSPFSAQLNYNKGKKLYLAGQYEQANKFFEKSLFADSKGILTRFYYAMSLSKMNPSYSVQKKIYELSTSDINDEASKMAKFQAAHIKYSLLNDVKDNYIYNASSGNDIIRWNIKTFPLKVYIQESNEAPPYYTENIKKALDIWASKTNFIKFTYTDTPNSANIEIKFAKINNADKSGKYVIAYTEPAISSKDNTLQKMTLTFYTTNPLGQPFSKTEIFNTALHETGHTLGIMGHSDNPNDAMYSMQNLQTESGFYKSEDYSLTNRDINTLVLLYRLEPTISDTPNLKSEYFYYPPLIIGSDDERLHKKLDEYTQYIKKYPDMASGYINIASVYANMGDFDSAERMLNKAAMLNETDDEKFLIEYNRAILYYNTQQFDKAKEFAQKAKAVKNDKNADILISEIEKLNNK